VIGENVFLLMKLLIQVVVIKEGLGESDERQEPATRNAIKTSSNTQIGFLLDSMQQLHSGIILHLFISDSESQVNEPLLGID